MKKEKKKFRIAFIKEKNGYGIQFNHGEEWLAECLFIGFENGKNEFGETYLVHEDILWKIDSLNKRGYEMWPLVRYNTQKGFWNVNEKDEY